MTAFSDYQRLVKFVTTRRPEHVLTPVILETPYQGEVGRNQRYAQLCMRDALLNHQEAPFASHLLYPQALDDNDAEERALGLHAGFAWGRFARLRVFYVDLGWSDGMYQGHQEAIALSQVIQERTLPPELLERLNA
jgi:hypothetical protein